jgi:hypothetical protein
MCMCMRMHMHVHVYVHVHVHVHASQAAAPSQARLHESFLLPRRIAPAALRQLLGRPGARTL